VDKLRRFYKMNKVKFLKTKHAFRNEVRDKDRIFEERVNFSA
jgi:hypothetical protein